MPPNNPKSDAIPASSTRVGPVECTSPDCPVRAEWHDMKGKVDEIHGALMGKPNEPGYFERVRNLEEANDAKEERDRKRNVVLGWAMGILLTPFITGLGYLLLEAIRNMKTP